MVFFLGQNFRILARKSVFCYRTPDFVNGPFVALAKAKILAPSDPFLNFSFPSYGRFREGDPPTQQKVLPHLTVGALTDSNSPSALRARAGLLELLSELLSEQLPTMNNVCNLLKCVVFQSAREARKGCYCQSVPPQ